MTGADKINNKKYTAREAAYHSLMLCERDGKYSSLEIDSSIRKFGLEGADKGLYTALVYGVIERRITLDYIIGKLSSKPADKLDNEVATLLWLGLYQLIWLDRIPESAAVNESVNLAKKTMPKAASFVNAVLRNFLRTMGKGNIPYPDKSDLREYLHVRYSVGYDALDILQNSVDDVEAVLRAFECQPDITLRVNTLKISREEMLASLIEQNIDAEPTRYCPFGIRLTGKTLPSQVLELISLGYVYIQDEASQIAVLAANPQPDTTLIDTCSCPGGKSFTSAILMENRGVVKSFDLHKNKLSLVRNGAKQLGIDIITTEEKDGAKRDDALVGTADTVICDAPCSGLGVIAKKPEIRYKSHSELERLPEIQYAILKNVSAYVKPGGVLCYSTCTLNKAENGEVVKRFLEQTDDFTAEDFKVGEAQSENGMLTLLPHIHKTDGFFVAKMRRK